MYTEDSQGGDIVVMCDCCLAVLAGEQQICTTCGAPLPVEATSVLPPGAVSWRERIVRPPRFPDGDGWALGD